jgi:hypothetical protein
MLLICFVLIVAMNLLSYYVKGLNRRSSMPGRTYGLIAGSPANRA